ncbi:MAG TPA: hypothetical protein VIX63_10695 [Vicinamibacterales bacterium]
MVARLACLSFLIVGAPALAGAATIVVTTTDPGIAGDGACSVVEAVVNANAGAVVHADCAGGPGPATIQLPPHEEILFVIRCMWAGSYRPRPSSGASSACWKKRST